MTYAVGVVLPGGEPARNPPSRRKSLTFQENNVKFGVGWGAVKPRQDQAPFPQEPTRRATDTRSVPIAVHQRWIHRLSASRDTHFDLPPLPARISLPKPTSPNFGGWRGP